MKRLVKESDFEPVFEIYMHESVHPFLGYDPMPPKEFKPIFSELVQSKNFFVYEQDDVVLAFWKVARYPGRCSHVAYVGTLAVSPQHHGKGLARQIIQETIEELKESGIKRIELIVESDNTRAIRFYESFGFQIEGTLKKFYKRASDEAYIDDHIMGLLLE